MIDDILRGQGFALENGPNLIYHAARRAAAAYAMDALHDTEVAKEAAAICAEETIERMPAGLHG